MTRTPLPGSALQLEIVPMSISDAREFVSRHHRHHAPPISGLFAIGLAAFWIG